jgi:outer membrane lipopolysaccharide assembly protein LptE/RlpB
MIQLRPLLNAVVSVVMVLAGCGYTFQGAGTILPPDIKRIYVANVENNTTQLGLSEILSEALKEQFESYGVVSIVEKQRDADAILNVKVADLSRTTRATRSNTDVAVQLETSLQLAAELRRVNGQVLWRDSKVKVSRGFANDQSSVVRSSAEFAGGGLSGADLSNFSAREISRGQESEVINRLAEDAALMIYNSAVAPDF